MKKIVAIIGSAGANSTNLKLIQLFQRQTAHVFNVYLYTGLKSLPHFDPQLSTDTPPEEIIEFRKFIEQADGVLISTPEYIFSVPSGLKNAIEWCVSTTVFSEKPLGIITASLDGQAGHLELIRIMKTLMADFTENTTLLISGIKSKIDEKGGIIHLQTKHDFNLFVAAFIHLVNK